ncbi:MAG TPA: DHHA1 domain-containing protein [Terracidiphilus sp.]|jgi:alanyl-tRNA synthetase
MPISERLYYADPFLKAFSAIVTQVREIPGASGESVWQLALDRSAFYPTSGGQPFDTGILRATSGSGAGLEIPVDQVDEDDDGQVWHYAGGPIAAGAPVEGVLNWDRRFDHMQQHTGQHLLSAVFRRELQAPTVSFHLGESVSTIDLACGPLAHHSLERVERIANEIIGEDRPVTIQTVSRADAESLLISGVLHKLPEREGSIRLIDIADCDRNACGGTHVRSTGQIGGLLVRRIEKVTRGVRVEFVCGMRAVRAARADLGILTELSAFLSSGSPELPAAVSRLQNESKAMGRERQKLREELAAYQGAAMAQEEASENGLRLVARTWKDRDRDYVRLLASRTVSAAPSTAAIFTAKDAEPARVFVARSRDLDFNCGQIMREALAQFGLRGGGSPDLAQGDIAADREPELHAVVVKAIREATGNIG